MIYCQYSSVHNIQRDNKKLLVDTALCMSKVKEEIIDEEKVIGNSDGSMYDCNIRGRKYGSMGSAGTEYRKR